MEHGYKIVYVDPAGLLRSVRWPFHINHAADIEYVPGVSAIPNEGCGPLAVFTSEEAATRFMVAELLGPFYHLMLERRPLAEGRCYHDQEMESHRHYRLFACDYTQTKGERNLWMTYDGLVRLKFAGVPRGTDFASTVILRHEIDLSRYIAPGTVPIRAPYYERTPDATQAQP